MPEIRPVSGVAQAVAASALRAQQSRMRIIAENLANADSTSKTAGGDPYRRQAPVFEPTKVAGAKGVRMSKIEPDQTAFREEYDPGHPSANAKGYVKLPNVNSLVEAMDMREAQRAYEANLNVIETARSMEMRTLELLRK
ncbi:MAG: flagellar basal body rod protein FlgC [Alphaproteobacteria bacterium]|nr:flagellar basal body rod protein FlgC [Alphaproteobacteria bacterium]MBU1515777.1 flagellar basal body rod protein FlgC [Alphaproteobacteria bacterium]MBU2093999.1 flagellar basal body rod protein FlgC [Alphaproteobacteria bacterium]MBU2153427.1 flagellar basal body rod protein FlgC [Alphaproteobacteria bacterium]MBU2308855.1 flagellar basal body rod protein FlgC [Alphaproteobacteria bacterium]